MMFLKTTIALMISIAVTDARANGIALDDVWALRMPGTKNVSELQKVPSGLSKAELLEQSVVAQIQTALHRRNMPGQGEPPRPVLVVRGTDIDALKEASRLFQEMNKLKTKKEPELIQPADEELSLVFYSYLCGRYVHLTSIEKSGSVITIKYRFVTHNTTNMTTHFALIPLGGNLKGRVRVKIIEEPPVDERGNKVEVHPLDRNLICDSVTFKVT